MLRTFAQSNRARSTGRDSARQIVIVSENKNIEKLYKMVRYVINI